jgi:hypothetical protein
VTKRTARARKRVRRKLKGRDLNGYRSGFEYDLSVSLRRNAKRFGYSWEYECEKFEYTTNHTYTPDFFITTRSGKRIIIEAKGHFLSKERTKHLAVREANPDMDLRFVFMKDNKLYNRSKTKYSDWARKKGFKYSIGEIDKEWYDE